MKEIHDKKQLRKVGKGFIVNTVEGMVGRMLTMAYVDTNDITYVKVNGEIIPLTEQHSFLAVD